MLWRAFCHVWTLSTYSPLHIYLNHGLFQDKYTPRSKTINIHPPSFSSSSVSFLSRFIWKLFFKPVIYYFFIKKFKKIYIFLDNILLLFYLLFVYFPFFSFLMNSASLILNTRMMILKPQRYPIPSTSRRMSAYTCMPTSVWRTDMDAYGMTKLTK